MDQKPGPAEEINKQRRTFLAMGLTGVAAFVVGRLFGGGGGSWGQDEPVRRAEFDGFILTETDAELSLTSKNGEPIVVVDKASFSE